MDIEQLTKNRREQIIRIAERHGANNVRIFGSIVRGEATPDSDIDLLVDVGQHRTPFFPGGLIADLQDLLGCKVEIVTRDALHECIRDRVLQEAVPL